MTKGHEFSEKHGKNEMICNDRLRRLVYDEIGKYFELKSEELVPKVEGICSICGEAVIGTPDASPEKKPSCRATRTITQNRSSPRAGYPIAFGVPNDPERRKDTLSAIGNLMLITPQRSTVITQVIPSMPIPETLDAIRGGPGTVSKFIKGFLLDIPSPPFLFVMWSRKASIPLVMTESLDRIMVCGTDNPRIVNYRAIMRNVAFIEKFGIETFVEACQFKTEMRHGEKKTSNETLQKILEKGVTIEHLKNLPFNKSSGHEGTEEFDWTMILMREEQNNDQTDEEISNAAE